MNEEINNYYVAVKTTIYDLYPVLKKLSKEDLERVFERLKNDASKRFSNIKLVEGYLTTAKNTYLFPFDNDLYNDLKGVEQKSILQVGLQEKYGINDQLLSEKHQEYHLFDFPNKVLGSDSANRFQYQSDIKKH